jgi:hypothetical protein
LGELVNRQCRLSQGIPRQLQMVRMVRKEQYLGLLGYFTKHPQGGSGAFIVESHQYIIQDDWARPCPGRMIFNVCQP